MENKNLVKIPVAAERKSNWLAGLKRTFGTREMVMVLLIIVTCIIMTILSPYFLSLTNFVAIARGFAMSGIVAVAMGLLLIVGHFDLSVGSNMALSGIVSAIMIVSMHLPYPVAVLGGLATGALIGVTNGVLVTRIHINALIATLGTMTIVRGIALGVTEGRPVINVPEKFAWIGQGSVIGIPIPFLVMFVIAVIVDVLLRRGRTLRQLYYVGGNQKAARLSGIPVDRIILLCFVGTGVAAALGGVLTMARLTSGIPTAFDDVALNVIAGCVIGGMSMAGGEGTILGAILGVVFMSLISNAMTMLSVSVYWEGCVTGAILIIAVGADMLSRHRL